jgi:hypothetical protein
MAGVRASRRTTIHPSICQRLRFSLSPLFYSRANSLTHNLHNNRRGWARKLEWSRRKESRPGNHVNDVLDCELRRWRRGPHTTLSLGAHRARLNFLGLTLAADWAAGRLNGARCVCKSCWFALANVTQSGFVFRPQCETDSIWSICLFRLPAISIIRR